MVVNLLRLIVVKGKCFSTMTPFGVPCIPYHYLMSAANQVVLFSALLTLTPPNPPIKQ
jgi:hypothetical protein